MENRWENYEYREIAEDLIDTEEALAPIKNSDVRIVFLSSDCKKKGSKVTETLGLCEKIPDKYKWAVPYDFSITIFEPNIEHLKSDQLRVLIFHELLHVGIGVKEGEYFVRPHDLEDFKLIVERFGIEWAKI